MSDSKRSRRQFTTEQEVALLQRHLVDKEPVSKTCDEDDLPSSASYPWLRQALGNLGAALKPPVSDTPSKGERGRDSACRDDQRCGQGMR
jgi:transposase-like protein